MPEEMWVNVFQSQVGFITNTSTFTNAEESFNINQSQGSTSSFDTKRFYEDPKAERPTFKKKIPNPKIQIPNKFQLPKF